MKLRDIYKRAALGCPNSRLASWTDFNARRLRNSNTASQPCVYWSELQPEFFQNARLRITSYLRVEHGNLRELAGREIRVMRAWISVV